MHCDRLQCCLQGQMSHRVPKAQGMLSCKLQPCLGSRFELRCIVEGCCKAKIDGLQWNTSRIPLEGGITGQAKRGQVFSDLKSLARTLCSINEAGSMTTK